MAHENLDNYTDIRLDHVTAIRNRLKNKKDEFCQHTHKKALGPDAIHNYLQNAGIPVSRTTIQNFFSDKR